MANTLQYLLSRNLSGVYRDPQRLIRDVETLQKTSLGRNLNPTTEPLTSNDGSVTPSVLVLNGTLPMVYRNVTYNIPIDLYLPPQYPQRAPIVYVRPVSSMAIKENHRHVGRDGMVYMPYLHEWVAQTHDLRELCVWMSSLFGSEPPCYARPAGAPRVSAASNVAATYGSRPPAYAQATQSTTNTFSPYVAASNSSNNRSREAEEQERRKQQQIEKEVAEANLAAKIAREESLKEAKLKVEQSRLHKDHEEKLSSMRVMATSKVEYELQVVFRDAKDDLRVTLKNQKLLDYGKEEIQQLLKEGEERKEELMALNDEMDGAVKKLEGWLEAAEIQQQQEGENGNNNSSSQSSKVDQIALPVDTHSSQMLQLAAENAAIDDCFYFLDQSLAQKNIPLKVFLEEVRKLSKRQFTVKAHLIKIRDAKASNPFDG
mmetsp:Transcript_21065/g.42135  ORF Transcript_21065/g.42135 Transcript_21065/m.42135 type:complete len:430 (-) Transcript_21065:111-1400(-)|eukprot:CAMPEP_0113410170 /NCGR_PEP_ID=MMETSP0013_2-20120614/21539_1 /TAXON_ID=2843 ORGANISM="Skeletonema costatum, Strain 1716" /NCGR_SAMPLE_ID=MMETSP0013_2 /ASSEMBLY_ACC=CAM_ASM_000158 /LENGTH=429 /DNA_ID=CAMNT_0000296339 /DNA_START=41 /DNA_END=1330 /DNA_ORIENTATION=+ /assembly_acc=CAM_ASM_000158